MGNLASIILGDDFISGEVIPIFLRMKYSIAEHVRLACTSTLARAHCQRILRELATPKILLSMCMNAPWDRRDYWAYSVPLLGEIYNCGNPWGEEKAKLEGNVVWMPFQHNLSYGIFQIVNMNPPSKQCKDMARLLVGGGFLSSACYVARFPMFEEAVLWATRPRIQEAPATSEVGGVKRARDEASGQEPAAKRTKLQ
jgi:hypothetical protein